jgi:hypothetical protein
VAVPGPSVDAPVEEALGEGVRVEIGPSALGRFVRVLFDVAALPAGRPVAPAAAAALMEADRRFGFGLGPLEPAVAVR